MIDIAVNDLQKEYQVGQPVLTGLTFQVDTCLLYTSDAADE